MSPPAAARTGLDAITLRDLNIVVGASVAVIVTSVTIGSIVAPSPWTHTTVKGTKCVADEGTTHQEWFLPEGPTRCHSLTHNNNTHKPTIGLHSNTTTSQADNNHPSWHVENGPVHSDTHSPTRDETATTSTHSPSRNDNHTTSRENSVLPPPPAVTSSHTVTTSELLDSSIASSQNPKTTTLLSSNNSRILHYPNTTLKHNTTKILHADNTSIQQQQQLRQQQTQHQHPAPPITSTLSAPPSLYPTPLDSTSSSHTHQHHHHHQHHHQHRLLQHDTTTTTINNNNSTSTLHALPATTSHNGTTSSLLLNTSLHNIVFAFQFPGQPQGASRWQQRLAGLLRLRLVHHQGWWGAGGGELSLETRLGYSDQPTAPPALLAHTVQARHVSCNPRQEHQFGGATYHCAPVPLVVLYSLFHPHYLVNIRLEGEHHSLTHIQDLYVSFISQDGRYTRVLVALQTLFFPTLACLLLWYLSALRQHHLQPPPQPTTPTTPTPYTANTVTTAIPHTATAVTTAIPYTGPGAIHYTVSSTTTAIMVIPSTATVTTVTAPMCKPGPCGGIDVDVNTTTTTATTDTTATDNTDPATTSTTTTTTTTTTAAPRIIAIAATSPAPAVLATSPTTALSPSIATAATTATTPPGASVPASVPATLTYFQIMLLLLASALLLVNCPWTYLTLVVDCPWLVILQELCLGLFYASFMTFLHFLTHLYLEPVNRCPKVRTAMARVIGGYAGALLLVECTEHWLLLHNPLPASWESLHLGLATITIILVLAYLAYITIRVYAAMKVLRRKAGKMKQRDPNLHHDQVRTQPVSWNLPETDTEREKEDQTLAGNLEGDEDQRLEKESVLKEQQMEHKDLKHLRTDPTTLLLGDQEKESLNDSEKMHLPTDPTSLLLGDQANDPLNDSNKRSLVKETKSMSPTSPADPEAALKGGRDPEAPTLMTGTVERPQWEAKNGRAWCDLVDERKRQQGWWREGGILLVSWVCVLLTATEFIIKRLHDGMWIWEDIFGNLEIENTSGLLLGVYSAWNVFTCVALLAYPPHPPPSHHPHTPTLGEVEVITDAQPVQQQEQQHCQMHQWSGGEQQLWQESHRQLWQQQRPPLVRQDAIDIVSLDSLEGVVVMSSSRAESQETDGGVMRLAVLSADGLISNDDAVSVYLISADSVASAEATLSETPATRESATGRIAATTTVVAAAASSNNVSAIGSTTSAGNETFTTGTCGSGGSRIHNPDTLLSGGESDSVGGGGGGGVIARSGRRGRSAPSIVLVNGVDARSLDDDGSDIGMIDEGTDCDISVRGVCGRGVAGVDGVCNGVSSSSGGAASVIHVSGGGSGGAVCDIRSGSGANSRGGDDGVHSSSANGDDFSSDSDQRVMNGKASFGSDTRSITDSL